MHPLLKRIGLTLPIVQAPMAGVTTPAMAAAVSNAGGLGSLGVGPLGADTARTMIRATRAATDRAFNVNVFCNAPARRDAQVEAAWLSRLAPVFATFGAAPPAGLDEIYGSFVEDDAMLAVLIEERPPVISFHFGLPSPVRLEALRETGAVMMATATSLAEAQAIAEAGLDAVVAQGYEAGGHRGVFDPDAPDAQLGVMALTRLLVRRTELPVIAAGGIMDGAGVAACLTLGAAAAQLGTAFIDTPESLADQAYRAALAAPAARTVMTRAISGRPARSLANRFTALGETAPNDQVPAYPVTYDAGKALNAAAKAAGETGYGAQWSGQGAAQARSMPTAELMKRLQAELEQALTR